MVDRRRRLPAGGNDYFRCLRQRSGARTGRLRL